MVLIYLFGVTLTLVALFKVGVFEGETEQFEWSQELDNGQTITLKGDMPDGYPSETWRDGDLLFRDEGSDSEIQWDVERGIPLVAAHIQDLDTCAELVVEVRRWSAVAGRNLSLAAEARVSAWATYALELADEAGCLPDR
jgi:hypothetical protein